MIVLRTIFICLWQINDKIKANKGFDPLDPINDCATHNIYLPPFVLRSKTTQINDKMKGNKGFDPLDPIFICLLLFYGVKQHKSMILFRQIRASILWIQSMILFRQSPYWIQRIESMILR
jgi:hypothetical protein